MSWLPSLQQLLLSMPRAARGGAHAGSSSRTQGGAPISSGSGGAGGPLVCCFTDFNAEAVHRARQLCVHLLAAGGDGTTAGGGCGGSGIRLESGLHPFRKPAAVLASDHALPSASNGFALWLTACHRAAC